MSYWTRHRICKLAEIQLRVALLIESMAEDAPDRDKLIESHEVLENVYAGAIDEWGREERLRDIQAFIDGLRPFVEQDISEREPGQPGTVTDSPEERQTKGIE